MSRHPLFAGALTLLLSGCAGSGDGLDENGAPLNDNTDTATAASEFDVIQNTIFTPLCTGCHSGANAPLGLSLAAGQSYAQLVGVPSAEVQSLLRVQAGDADNSYLIQKLAGTAAVGDRMPAGGPYLSPADIDRVRQWIANGAPPPSTNSAVSNAMQDLLGPGMKVSVAAPASQFIVIGFDRDVDTTLANATTVSLRRSGEERAISVRLASPQANPTTLMIVPSTPLGAGAYELTLRGSGGGALAGLDARPLNAPAGREAGEDYSLHFSVETR